MDNLLIQIAQGSTSLAILAYAVWYLKQQIKKKEEEIKDLQKELRDSEKEYLTILYKVVGFMERGESNYENLKTFISDKIDSLKNGKQ